MDRDLPVSRKTGRFTRHQRLIRPEQFKRVFNRPVRVGDDYFSVLGQNNQQPIARLGLAIARKQIRRAVGRNRIKRLLRESFRQNQQKLAGLDIIILLRADASRLNNESVRQRLINLWQSLIEKCENY